MNLKLTGYFKKFEIRWSDIDANQHLGNTAYVNFMSHVRMSFFRDGGFGMDSFVSNGLIPVVLYEHIYYFREILTNTPVWVTLELKGLSAKFEFFEFVHNFYVGDGKNMARCNIVGTWLNVKDRKINSPPAQLIEIMNLLDKTPDYREITKADTRKYNVRPWDL